MLFNSYSFIFFFLPLCLLMARFLRSQLLLAFITLASLYFYAAHGHAWFVIPMLFTTVVDFVLAKDMESGKPFLSRLRILQISLVLNLGLLFFFKYTGFFIKSLPGHVEAQMPDWLFHIVLPAGISFYSFQTMSYMIDVYRGHAKVEKNFWLFSSFVSFFPHLVAGPLTRHDQLIPQLKKIAQEGIKPWWRDGLLLFTFGLAKKILIADRISELIDPMLNDPGHLGVSGAWICMIGYTMQIYFDFSGYSDMALGIARFFSIELPQNFAAPYRSESIVEFWRRWHMTLSSWLRDYLYISLGGNRQGPSRQKINLMLTMFLGGLWHGASWNFAIWGLFHGFLLILNHAFSESWNRVWLPLRRAVTLLLVGIGWIFFRAADLSGATQWFLQLWSFNGNWKPESFDPESLKKAAVLGLVALAMTQFFPRPMSEPGRFAGWNRWQIAGAGVLFSISLMFLEHSSKFLYFQF